jgi:ketosteroid isomerase-like protein
MVRKRDMTKMRSTILLIIAVLGVMCGGRTLLAQSPNSDADKEKAIRALEHVRFVAMQKRDMATLGRTLGDELVFIDTKGRLLNKAEYMQEVRSGDLKFLTVDNSDNEFYVYGNTVIMSGVAKSEIEYRGKINKIPRRFTSVFVKTNGQWLLVAHQATLIVEK